MHWSMRSSGTGTCTLSMPPIVVSMSTSDGVTHTKRHFNRNHSFPRYNVMSNSDIPHHSVKSAIIRGFAMGRRKPLVVQRKRPRAAAPDALDNEVDGGSSGRRDSSESRDSNDSRDASDGGELAVLEGGDDDDEWRANKRRKSVFQGNDPLLAALDGRARMPLTFRASWSPERRADALWLKWTLQPDAHAALAAALQQLHEDADADGDNEAVVGAEVSGESGLLTLRADDGDGASAATTMTLNDLFPGAGGEWQTQLLGLVDDELLLLEIVDRPSGDDDAVAFELRAGVAWRAYAEIPRRHEFPRANQRQSSHLKMQRVMLWLLANARAAERQQCEYPYWSEIDALYQRAFTRAGAWSEAFDIHDFYARIDVQKQLQRDTRSFDHARGAAESSLLPSLRPYQKAAVSWMLERETREWQPRAEVSTLVRFPRGADELRYDPFRARFYELRDTVDGVAATAAASDLSAVRGGILADEMGLGKTVEVIALVLSNPWSGSTPALLSHHDLPPQTLDSDERGCICGSATDEARGWVQCAFCLRWHHRLCTGHSTDATFLCFHCQPVQKPEFSCKTTLIVSPESILDQWETELQRHVKPGVLKVLQYPGVRTLRRSLERLKQPSAEWQVLANAGLYLAAFDVVLTTYEVLSADLLYLPNDATHERRASTRQKKKAYTYMSSPLVYLRFWRVCMDEAQLGVENTQLKTALTVAELKAELKWVVTGTPFSTQVGDLFGCLKFLRLAPFDDELGAVAFDTVIKNTFQHGAIDRLLDILLWDGHSCGGERHSGGGLLWRTSKRDVRHQLGLLDQKTEVVWCRFSDVERHFYSEQEKTVVKKVAEYQRQQPREAAALSAGTGVTDAIWQDLLGLRQICCHPRIGSARAGAAFSLRGRAADNGVLSMDAFLKELVVKCKRECEEAQRKLVAAHNALAAIHLIQHERPAAILKYVVAITAVKKNWALFRADLLPRLHILENLARCVRAVFGVRAAADADDARRDDGEGATAADTASVVRRELSTVESEVRDAASNPKVHALLPDLPALTRTITLDASEEAMREHADVAAIARECELLDVCAQKIKRFYLYQVEASHASALNAFEAVAQKVEDAVVRRSSVESSKRAVLCERSLWWLSALAALEQHEPELAASFAHRVHSRLLAFGTPWAVRFCNQFTTVSGFRLVFLNELEELAKKRKALYAKLQQLSARPPTKRDVELSGNCRKCRDGRDGPPCAHCTLYRDFEAFKRHFQGFDSNVPETLASVFSNSRASRRSQRSDSVEEEEGEEDKDKEDDDGGGAATSSSSSSSLIVEIFREIASVTRSAAAREEDASAPQDGLRAEVEFWTHVQREWHAARKLFQAQHQRLGGLDELEMATLQIRLRLEGEVVVSRAESEYKLLAAEVPARLMKFESERVVADLEMHEKMARLRFLTQLGEQHEPSATAAHTPTAPATASKSVCAVCLEEMANERVMLPCAHVFCKSCIQTLMKQRAASGSVRCPTCRLSCSASKVAVVFEDVESVNARLAATKRGSQSTRPVADAHIQLRRSGFGSKMDAVVRRVLALAQENVHVKCLLFTQWQGVMSIVAEHLRQNGVTCLTYGTKKEFPRVVQQFKQCLEPCVLALPFKVGANGLNLVEATEVLLVEPLLNTSIEAQAINRVHRIGQTKQTRVHRFVVDNSVEERIFWLGHTKKKATTKHQDAASGVAALEAAGDDADKENVDGNNTDAEDAVERAPSKKEKEQLSLSELHVLLDGKLGGIRERGEDVDDDDSEKEEGDEESELHPFWQEQVVLDGRTVERLDAKLVLERREAAERRERAPNADQQQLGASPPPLTHLFDLELNVVVANEVVRLTHASTLEQTHAISTELLAFHRARLHEELAVWRAAA